MNLRIPLKETTSWMVFLVIPAENQHTLAHFPPTPLGPCPRPAPLRAAGKGSAAGVPLGAGFAASPPETFFRP